MIDLGDFYQEGMKILEEYNKDQNSINKMEIKYFKSRIYIDYWSVLNKYHHKLITNTDYIDRYKENNMHLYKLKTFPYFNIECKVSKQDINNYKFNRERNKILIEYNDRDKKQYEENKETWKKLNDRLDDLKKERNIENLKKLINIMQTNEFTKNITFEDKLSIVKSKW